MRKHTDKELLDELIRLKNLLGRNPKQKDFDNHSVYSVNSYKRAFGGLSKALIKIGEAPNIKLDAANYDIHDQIKKVYKFLNHIPSIEEFDKYSDISYMAIRRLHPNLNWYKLMLDVGLPLNEIAKMTKQYITNEDLKQEIIRLTKKLGRYPTYYETNTMSLYSCDTYIKRFGSYIKAMKAFGFNYKSQSVFHNQIHTAGADGIMYKSKFEANIGDYLLEKKNAHVILDYVYEKKVTDSRTWTCDFWIKFANTEIWLEADGMGKNRARPYNEDNEKIKFYIQNNYKFYILQYRKNIETQLNEIFNNILTPSYNKVLCVNHQNLSKSYLSTLSENERLDMVDNIFEYIRNSVGFPYPDDIGKVRTEWKNIINYKPNIDQNIINNNTSLGTYICKYFCKSFYSAITPGNLSPIEVFYNDELLKKVIKNRLSIGWTTKSGAHEFFNITPGMILQGMRSGRISSTVSMFKPSVAKYIYEKFSDKNDVVFDYSAGFGGRLLGAASCGRKYIGIDPLTYKELQQMIAILELKNCKVKFGCSEKKILLKENSVDLAFSSPPYYNTEIYSLDKNQAYNKGEEYFYDIYWKNTLKNIKYILKPDKYFIVNVDNNKMFEMAESYFSYVKSIDMKMHFDHMSKKNKLTKCEKIYVFTNN